MLQNIFTVLRSHNY